MCRRLPCGAGGAPNEVELALSTLVAVDGIASHSLAGGIHGLDSVRLAAPFVTVSPESRSGRPGLRKRNLASERVITLRGYRCTDGLQTLVDLAAVMTDIMWEQALESALRMRLTTIDAIESILPDLARGRTPGVKRIRRVLGLRPPGAPPTESLLETLAVQLIRTDPTLPTPERQVEVFDRWERFVARVDLAYPSHDVFLELDGQQHLDQPQYDATRQTAVVAAMKWLPARFTWDDITRQQRHTLRRLGELLQ